MNTHNHGYHRVYQCTKLFLSPCHSPNTEVLETSGLRVGRPCLPGRWPLFGRPLPCGRVRLEGVQRPKASCNHVRCSAVNGATEGLPPVAMLTVERETRGAGKLQAGVCLPRGTWSVRGTVGRPYLVALECRSSVAVMSRNTICFV